MKADLFLKRAAVVALGVVSFFAPGGAWAASQWTCGSWMGGFTPAENNIARGDFRIRGGSPAVNAATKLGWMTDDATDLLGAPRVMGLVPDMGCYENPNKGLQLLVR